MQNKRKSISEFKSKIYKEYETILLGDANIGKTTYMRKLIRQECHMNTQSSVSDDKNSFEFLFELNENKAIFILKDTANQEKFRSLTQSYYRKAPCILLMFDLYNQETFDNLLNWYHDIENYSTQRKQIAIILVGLMRCGGKSESSSFKIRQDLVDAFKEEYDEIIGYCEIDLSDESPYNLKEPFQILLNYLTQLPVSGRQSIISLNGRYSSMNQQYNMNETISEDEKSNEKHKNCCILS